MKNSHRHQPHTNHLHHRATGKTRSHVVTLNNPNIQRPMESGILRVHMKVGKAHKGKWS